jgi:hypothetical protein
MAVFWVVALMMEAAQTSEMLVNSYQSTWRYNPEDSHLHRHCHENLKSYLLTALLNKPQINELNLSGITFAPDVM